MSLCVKFQPDTQNWKIVATYLNPSDTQLTVLPFNHNHSKEFPVGCGRLLVFLFVIFILFLHFAHLPYLVTNFDKPVSSS